MSVCTKGFAYLLCWPRGRGVGLTCTPRFSFHEFYNFLLFNFLIFGKLFFTHDIYPHPRPRPTIHSKSTSWRAERALFGRKAADRERRSRERSPAIWNPTKDFFETLGLSVWWFSSDRKYLVIWKWNSFNFEWTNRLTLSVNFDGQFQDGIAPFQIACVQPPPPLRKNRRRGVCGEGATVHRLVSDG